MLVIPEPIQVVAAVFMVMMMMMMMMVMMMAMMRTVMAVEFVMLVVIISCISDPALLQLFHDIAIAHVACGERSFPAFFLSL
jgi:hypothetical protein